MSALKFVVDNKSLFFGKMAQNLDGRVNGRCEINVTSNLTRVWIRPQKHDK